MKVRNVITGHHWIITKEKEMLSTLKDKDFEIVEISPAEQSLIDALKKAVPKTLREKLMTPY